MSVRPHKTKSNTWVIDYYPEGRKGKRVQRQFRGSETEARTLEMNLRRAPGQGIKTRPKVIDLIPTWLEFCRNNLAPTTCRDIKGCVALHILPFFGHTYIFTLTPQLIEEYKTKRRKEPAKGYKNGQDERPEVRSSVGKRTINKELSYFSSFLSWASDSGHCEPVPFKIKKFPKIRPPKPHPLNLEQIDTLLDAIEPCYLLIVMLMCDAGLRKTEALKLRADDIELDRSIIYVRGKGNKERIVPIMTARLEEALSQEISKAESPESYLSVNPKTGKPFSAIKKALSRAAKKADISRHVNHHLLRHSWGTNATIAGLDFRAIQSIMGHSDPRTTQLYSQIAAQYLHDQGRKFDHHTSDNSDA